ncbi:MAG: M48 family metalloprotease [Rhizobiales bacterium]|nr:M48 family metalloprotease [Hyphomicrobiales bacterium]
MAAVVLILAPLIGVLLQLAVSRSREYQADLNAFQLTGDPMGLASALQTLERKQGALWKSLLLPGGSIPDPSMLRTHPRTEDRVERLHALTPQCEPDLIQAGQLADTPFGSERTTRKPRYRIGGLWY